MQEQFTISQIIAELKRENSMRRSVYPKLVQAQKMTEEEMARRINIIEAAIAILKKHDSLPLFSQEGGF